ncbi:MAG: hypothetical protein AB1490_04465 [Pseudomonadota bacterium]
MFEPVAFYSIMTAGILGAAGLGGGLYETLLVDRAWPHMPVLIQPDRGGINRKLFWGPIHGLFELALVVAIWSTWTEPTVRLWVWSAFAVHLAVRVWSFAYFIPMALRFEAGAPEATPEAAKKWINLSRWRLPLELLAVIFLLIALAQSPTVRS